MKRVSNFNWNGVDLYGCFCLLLSALITFRGLSRYHKFIHDFHKVTLIPATDLKLFLPVVGWHLLILWLAYRCHKVWGELQWSTYYLAIQFIFYFTLLITGLLPNCPDQVPIFGLLIITIFLTSRSVTKTDTPKISCPWPFGFPWLPVILLLVWLIQTLLYYVYFNFGTQRAPWADECLFWYKAAANIVTYGFNYAHSQRYESYHPLGIPLIGALPLISSFDSNLRSLFFFPLSVICAMTIFLWERRKSPGVFLFLLIALLVVINSRGWIMCVCYGAFYGEGISVVYMLAIINEVFRFLQETPLSQKTRLMMVSFFIGMSCFTKIPLAYFYFIFFAILWIGIIFTPSHKSIKSWQNFLLSSFCCFLPKAIFAFYYYIHHFISEPLHMGNLNEAFKGFNSFHFDAMAVICNELFFNSDKAIYLGLLSAALIVFLDIKRLWPIFLLPVIFILGVLIFVGYFPQGGAAFPILGKGNTLRYLLPGLFSLIYLGGYAFDKLLSSLKIETLPLWQLIVSVATVGILICQLGY